MNKFGYASPTTILTLLEETAADHCNSINYDLYKLERQNVGWVLLSGVMQMERYPRYKDKITIRTWLSGFSSIKGFRENIIYDNQNNIIGRAKGLWLFFDLKRRRPTRVFDDIIKKWSFYNQESIPDDITGKIEPIDSDIDALEFSIRRYDTDMNKHVNNIRYLQWAVESIPEEIVSDYYLYSINGRFLAEAQFGDTILSLTRNDSGDTSFIHTIKVQGSNKVCATARSVWKKNPEK